MATNTNPARGMRDFLPIDVRRREYVIKIIKEVYESYGFEPLETPSVENLETLTGKYGEEGNQLIFKILKRGEKLSEELQAGKIKSENELSDLALRYDLTVPLARVVANNKNDLPKFFKRYQIQPVWRADRPARGRFREFYQCDVDAIGSKSIVVETELISAVSEILLRLGFNDFSIQLNHRKVLSALLNSLGLATEKHVEALIIFDKVDKIGPEAAVKELTDIGLLEGILKITDLLRDINDKKREVILAGVGKRRSEVFGEYNKTILERIHGLTFGEEDGKQGLSDIRKIINALANIQLDGRITFNPLLARGLSYYTGAIMEVTLHDEDFKLSVGGGGRYDGLIGMFGKEEIPACGFSLGLERILVVMNERGMFPPELQTNSADVLVTVWNEETIGESLQLANELRQQGVRVFVYPEAEKLGKQFKYASQINVPFVAVAGDDERAKGVVRFKNMQTGAETDVQRDKIGSEVKDLLKPQPPFEV